MRKKAENPNKFVLILGLQEKSWQSTFFGSVCYKDKIYFKIIEVPIYDQIDNFLTFFSITMSTSHHTVRMRNFMQFNSLDNILMTIQVVHF